MNTPSRLRTREHNRARHQRGSPSIRLIADLVGLHFAHDPRGDRRGAPNSRDSTTKHTGLPGLQRSRSHLIVAVGEDLGLQRRSTIGRTPSQALAWARRASEDACHGYGGRIGRARWCWPAARGELPAGLDRRAGGFDVDRHATRKVPGPGSTARSRVGRSRSPNWPCALPCRLPFSSSLMASRSLRTTPNPRLSIYPPGYGAKTPMARLERSSFARVSHTSVASAACTCRPRVPAHPPRSARVIRTAMLVGVGLAVAG
jgi:hypothetical protein